MHKHLLLVAALLLSGCGTVDSLRQRVTEDAPPHVRVFPADPRATFAAARAALDSIGYTFVRGGPAQGRMEALSAILPGEAGENARQISLSAQFRAAEGGTEVGVVLKEIVEDDSARLGVATTAPLRDTPLYEVFFRAIQANLPPAGPSSGG